MSVRPFYRPPSVLTEQHPMTHFQLTETDQEFLRREVETFLPDRIFDAHAHLFCKCHYPAGTVPAHLANAPE